MSRNFARGLHKASASLMQFTGAPLEEMVITNGTIDGPVWIDTTNSVCNSIGKSVPEITTAEIQASKAHFSSNDREDQSLVVTVGLKTNAGTHIGTIHIHQDKTWKFLASREGREDLQLKNLLLPTPKPKALFEFEEEELRMPTARKVLQDRTIYKSSRFPPGDGLPLLSDFGEARLGDEEHNEDIMPDPYEAPEVILRANWDYKVDIWSVAMVAWDIDPPPEFHERSHLSSVFWENTGTWKGLAPVPDTTLESLAIDIRGEDKDGFLRWIRRALQWNPSDRPTALGLLYDEWLMKGLELGKRKGTTKS
ncbi:U4/U6 small nuclear ribonucleoprotein PRP4 [Aspergillus tubingensis]|uniref:U4/U6 small nuclear ribonucleoprotein PRP4 n=1 Tax=Aspergillus tubingensis TaxID=5068 RepID=UPI00157922FF|nr:U4/U6 small nuclear ribonucleo protein PRP4 [Aspergillus tubingensis]GFN20294.1 U4/U6 small nuclear ribonucleo protein PRP4 [Aspergillus tubingensis]